jgi:RHS repeat-associated protein
MFKRIYIIMFICLLANITKAQFNFSGPNPALEGSTQKYIFSYTGTLPSGLNLSFQVTNGSITSQQLNPYTNNQVSVMVQWNCSATLGTIQLINATTGLVNTQTISIASYANYAGLCFSMNNASQNVGYGEVPQSLFVTDCPQDCGYTKTYSWETGDVNIATPNADPAVWNLAGVTTDVLNPPAMYAYGIKAYRRITTIRNAAGTIIRTVTSEKATVNFLQQFNPGSISSPEWIVSYNAVPYISQYPATGGLCFANSYIYTWEWSIEGGPWQTIGTGADFPTLAVGFLGATKVRRKVSCGGMELISNELSFAVEYVSANTENRNYIRENTMLVPNVYSWAQADNLPVGQKTQVTTYFDGLGRSIQAVSKGSSFKFVEPTIGNANPIQPDPLLPSSYQDMVAIADYDALGRTPKNYLPYATSAWPGLYKPDAGTEQAVMLQNKYGEPNAPTYSLATYDNSPLNRVLNAKAAGAGWGGDANYKGNSEDYDLVPATENIRIWTIDYSATGLPISNTGHVYADAKLMKYTSFDEKEKRTITYKDLNGNVVLKKVQKEDVGPLLDESGYNGWLCTYYVYDDFNQLRYTLPPKAVQYLALHNWTMTTAIANDLCFYYQYDAKGRNIVKHSPAAGEVHLIYDNRDRLVLSQTAEQRSNSGNLPQWSFFLYDELNRPVADGVVNNIDTRDIWQNEVNNLSNQIEYIDAPVDYGSTEPLFAHSPCVDPQGQFCSNCRYAVFNSITYYDDYNYLNAKPFSGDYAFAATASQYIQPMTASARLLDKVTGSKTRELRPDNYNDNNSTNVRYFTSTVYYDERGSMIQAQSDNSKNGTDIVSSQYDFAGRTLGNCNTHTAPGTAYTSYKMVTAYQYDLLGRVLSVSKGYNSSTILKTISRFSYDDLGQLANKKLGKKPGNTDPLETLAYSYNMNGMLTGINKDYALTPIDMKQWDNYFGAYFAYNNGDAGMHKEWNGKLAGTIWKTQGDNTPRQYEYTYDNAGRFTNAVFKQKDKPSAGTWAATTVNFSSSTSYDANGNITALQQYGIVPGTPTPVLVDNMSYQYGNPETINGTTYQWGNQLLKVQDAVGTQAHNGKLGDFKNNSAAATDYLYDEDGNLITDQNKGLVQTSGSQGVVYNYFGKPQLIYNTVKQINVEYTYDAAGNKLAKKTTDYHVPGNTVVSTTYYMGEFIYTDNTLDFILHEEGRLRLLQQQSNAQLAINGGDNLVTMPDGRQGTFDYFIKDEKGNTRMMLTEEAHTQYDYCGMELANQTAENNSFSSGANEVNATRADINGIWTSHYVAGSNERASKLWNIGGKRIGPNMIYKVMAGDLIHAKVDYYYQGTAVSGGASQYLTNVAHALGGTIFNSSQVPGGAVKANHDDIKNLLGLPNSPLDIFLSNNTPTNPSTPRAYLNYLFFDEQFNFVSQSSGASPVKASNDDQISVNGLKAPKNGYVFVFLSNESDLPVYFDQFYVTHERGAILEENHYYPQGLKIAGICAKAFAKPLNPYNYQGDYSEEEGETGWNDFDLRSYDPQTGRWLQADPYDEFASPYIGMGGDPVNNVDPDGGNINPLFDMLGAGAAIYLIAKNNGVKGGALVAATIGGGLVGGALIHSALASLTADESLLLDGGSKNLWQNVKAFFVGIFTGRGSSSPYNSLYSPNHESQAIIPDVWGWLGLGGSNGTTTITNSGTSGGPISDGPPQLPRIRDAIDRVIIDRPQRPNIIRDRNVPNVGLPRLCFCQRTVNTGRFNPILFTFTQDVRNAPDVVGGSYMGLGLSDEEFDAANSLTDQLVRLIQPGDVVRASIVQRLEWVGQIPDGDIPNVINGLEQINPRTNRRMDHGAGSLRPQDPRIIGMTSSQIWNAQTTLMANMIRRRLPGRSRVSPLNTIRTISPPRFTLQGRILRPITTNVLVPCACE